MDQNLAEQMMRMMTGGVVAQSIAVAAELGIADQLASGEKKREEQFSASGAGVCA